MNDKWSIIYEDNSIMVIHKLPGIATETARLGAKDLVSEIKSYLKKKGESTYLGVIHRLDQPVEGIVVFAKTKVAAAFLSNQVTGNNGRSMVKEYKALVYGHMSCDKGTFTDYLVHDGKTNSSYVTDAKAIGAKKAILEYEVIEKNADTDLVRILLKTGRHHQIRVQFAHAGNPLVGDVKYGTKESISYAKTIGGSQMENVNLIAFRLSFLHPDTNKEVVFQI